MKPKHRKRFIAFLPDTDWIRHHEAVEAFEKFWSATYANNGGSRGDSEYYRRIRNLRKSHNERKSNDTHTTEKPRSA